MRAPLKPGRNSDRGEEGCRDHGVVLTPPEPVQEKGAASAAAIGPAEAERRQSLDAFWSCKALIPISHSPVDLPCPPVRLDSLPQANPPPVFD